MKAEGSAVTGGTYTEGHIALPRARDNRRGHAEQARKPTGLDWSKTTPACKSCGTRTSALNRDDQCTTCAPRPRATTSSVVEKREPARPRTPRKRRQYQRPIGPRRARGTASKAKVDTIALLDAYRAGATPPQLAARFGIMPTTVRRILDSSGIQRRDDRRGHSGGGNRIPAETRAQVVRLYAEGLSKPRVAARLGIGVQSVNRIMNEAGVTARQRQSGQHDGARGLKDRIHELGTSSAEIRTWARSQGLDVTLRGTVPASLVDAWERARE